MLFGEIPVGNNSVTMRDFDSRFLGLVSHAGDRSFSHIRVEVICVNFDNPLIIVNFLKPGYEPN